VIIDYEDFEESSIVKDADLSFTFHYHSGRVFGNTKKQTPKNRFQQEFCSKISPSQTIQQPKKNCLVQKPGITLGVLQIFPSFEVPNHPTNFPASDPVRSRPPCYHPASRNIEPR